MNLREICHILGKYLFLFTLVLLLPLAVSVFYEFIIKNPVTYSDHSTRSFILTIFISLILAFIFRFFGRGGTGKLRRKESIFLVGIIWSISVLIGALPFIFTKTLSNPLDAIFESASGFTTTGSSIIYPKSYNDRKEEVPIILSVQSQPNIQYAFFGTIAPLEDPKTGIVYQGFDAISRPILFWRSFTQWIGGMGIVVFFLAIFPLLSLGGKFLYEASFTEESPSYHEALKPRIRETTQALLKTYLGLTALQIVFLMLFNKEITLFEAIATTFSTISTGGFTVAAGSIGFFQDPSTEWIVMLFMIFGGMNFALFFFLIKGRFRKFREPEFPFFCLTLVLICGLIIWQVSRYGPFTNFLQSIRPACFQGISALTTTGFYTANFDIWPFGAQALMLLAMYIGSMAGSTSSGVKIDRHLILFRVMSSRMEKLFRPETVRTLTIGNREIPRQHIVNVFSFVAILIIVSSIGTLFFIFDGIDLQTAFGLIASAINNVGFAFRGAGPDGTCAILPAFSKIIMILWMFLGRLELFAFIVLFLPSFWKEK